MSQKSTGPGYVEIPVKVSLPKTGKGHIITENDPVPPLEVHLEIAIPHPSKRSEGQRPEEQARQIILRVIKTILVEQGWPLPLPDFAEQIKVSRSPDWDDRLLARVPYDVFPAECGIFGWHRFNAAFNDPKFELKPPRNPNR